MIKDVIKTSAQEEAQQWCYRMLSKFGDINAMEKFEQNKLACASSYLDSAKFEILELEAGSAKAALDVLTKKSETVSFSVPIISNLLRETKKRAETNKRKAELQTKMDNELGLIRIDVKSDNNCYFRSIGE